VGLDGKRAGTADHRKTRNHDVTLSPSGKYFTDSYSTPATPPVALVRNVEGKLNFDPRKGRRFEVVRRAGAPCAITVKRATA